MSVTVQCNHCSNVLELDDGFRGGVCRCSQCGALLQVPKETREAVRGSRPAAPGAARPNAPVPTPQPEIEEEEDPWREAIRVDPRSGLVGFEREPVKPVKLPHERREDPQVPKAPKANNLLIWGMAIGGVVILLLLVVIGLSLLSGSGNARRPDNASSPEASAMPEADLSGQPNCLGVIPLVGKKILFSIDASRSSQDSFDFLRKGLLNAIDTLAPDQQFRVAFWDSATLRLLPHHGWENKDGLSGFKREIDNVVAQGSSEAEAALPKSLELGADQVIFITAKNTLPSNLAAKAFSAGLPRPRIDAIKLKTVDPNSPLESMTRQTGGKFIQMDEVTLESHVPDSK